ncbi:uncharacterized protein LOC144120735 [Amblyomma americanum]
MEIRPFLIACFLAAVAARSPFYGDPRWRCISRAPGDNPGEVHIVEKPDLCIYFCSTDNSTWNFGLYLDKTPCKTEGKDGTCKEGECIEPEAPGPEEAGPGKKKKKADKGHKEGGEDVGTGSTAPPQPPPPPPSDLEDADANRNETESPPPSPGPVSTSD